MTLSTGEKIGIGAAITAAVVGVVALFWPKTRTGVTPQDNTPPPGGQTPDPGDKVFQPGPSGEVDLTPGGMGTMTMLGDKTNTDINLYAPGSPLKHQGTVADMGLIQSVSSSDPTIVTPFTATGDGPNGVTLSVIGEGTTVLTISWKYKGQSQVSAIRIKAVAR